jgi:hypothetical protein
MHIPLHPATHHHTIRSTARDLLALLAAWLHAFALTAGVVIRFVALTVLACLFISAPISFREVP